MTMSLVLRLARLPLPVASVISESLFHNARLRDQTFRQRYSLHIYAGLRCQTNLKTNASYSNESLSAKPAIAAASTDNHSTTSRSASIPSVKTFSNDSKGSKEKSTDEASSKSKNDANAFAGTGKGGGEDPPKPQPPNPNKPKLSREAVRQNVKGYVFTRYFDYVKNYDRVLEKNFPAAFKLYRVFFDGMRDFYADMKRYLKVWRIANSSPNGLRALNRKELELFMQMPRDMVKVAPALIGTSLPMIGYAFFPLVFMYPRRFLTSHFWTLQQRVEFQEAQLHERFNFNRTVFRCLQAKLKSTKQHEKHVEFSNILGLIGSGFHPTVESLIDIKDIFAKPPYNLQSLSGKHIKNLVGMHGLSGGLSKRFRLTEHAFLVHHMDLAIGREGGAHNMPLDAMQKSCAIRGLNPANMSKEDMTAWLRNWIAISTAIEEEHISLFLHLPIFLAYNHPNNWKLIYGPNKSKATSSSTADSNSSQQQQQ